MTLENFALLIVACLAVNLSPGPSVVLVSSVAAADGFRAGFMAVLGMTLGAFVHVLLAASGVAALLASSKLAFAIVQYLGAVYLIYLGIHLLLTKNNNPAVTPRSTATSDWQFFRRGMLVDTLNPKIALFFLAFIPQFLLLVKNPGFFISLALGSVFLLTGLLVNGVIAWLVAAGASRTRGQIADWVQRRIPAAVLVFLGLRLLWQKV